MLIWIHHHTHTIENCVGLDHDILYVSCGIPSHRRIVRGARKLGLGRNQVDTRRGKYPIKVHECCV